MNFYEYNKIQEQKTIEREIRETKKLTREIIDFIFSEPTRFFRNPELPKAICEMRLSGAKYEDIGKAVNLSGTRCRQYVERTMAAYRNHLRKKAFTDSVTNTVKGQEDKMKIKIKLDEGAFVPESAHEADAGYDLRTPTDCYVPGAGFAIIDTGVHIAIPKGYVGFLKSKSGLNVRDHLTGEGVIDSGYTGSIVVKLYHNYSGGKQFRRGDKIIQIVLLPIIKPELEIVDSLEETERGDNGFGSSGR